MNTIKIAFALLIVAALLMFGCTGTPPAGGNQTPKDNASVSGGNASPAGNVSESPPQTEPPPSQAPAQTNTSSGTGTTGNTANKSTDKPAVPTGSGGVAVDVGGSIPITPE